MVGMHESLLVPNHFRRRRKRRRRKRRRKRKRKRRRRRDGEGGEEEEEEEEGKRRRERGGGGETSQYMYFYVCIHNTLWKHTCIILYTHCTLINIIYKSHRCFPRRRSPLQGEGCPQPPAST